MRGGDSSSHRAGQVVSHIARTAHLPDSESAYRGINPTDTDDFMNWLQAALKPEGFSASIERLICDARFPSQAVLKRMTFSGLWEILLAHKVLTVDGVEMVDWRK